MSGKSISLSPDWVRCQSKNRPGRYFMYNKETGETTWCDDAVNYVSPQKAVSVNDIVKTPAQDRLKRLQSSLQKKKPNEPTTSSAKGGRLIKKVESVQKNTTEGLSVKTVPVPESVDAGPIKAVQTNKTTETKSSSVLSGLIVRPKKLSNRTAEEALSSESKPKLKMEEHKFVIPKTVSKSHSCSKAERPAESKHQPVLPKLRRNSEKKTASTDKSWACNDNSVESRNKPYDRQPERFVSDVNDNQQPLEKKPKPSIVSRVKDFYNNFISKATKPNKRKCPPNKDKERTTNLSLNSKPSFKPKKPDNKSTLRGVLLENESGIIQKQLPSKHEVSAPILVPRDSANARLQRLRNSLHLQQTTRSLTANASNASSTLNSTLDSSDVNSGKSSPSFSTSECEPMDWQPIIDELAENVITPSPNVQSANSSALSEHYDTVNENLMRLAAEKKQNRQWKPDHFYFVIDTNVFLQNMTFIEELTTMQLCDTIGTLIYVPYCVLQELDKLKIRSPSESIKTRSARAIKYLNKSFEEKHQRIQAQSAADETKHLIKVTSPDDSILNCCLQVKQHIENVLLLTEDINLQNKAMCNDILVSTKSDLISKHESLI